jgi:hypothetical protein
MIGADVLMSRALLWAVDQHDLTIDSLANMNGDLKNQLMDLSVTVAEDMKFNDLTKK